MGITDKYGLIVQTPRSDSGLVNMLIVADENMPLVDEYFGGYAEIRRLPGRGIRASDVRDADALLVRSVTPVGADLLCGSRVRFVGTATIGRDHLDEGWLQSNGIRVASAPGCNARAVAEYVVGVLLEAAGSIGSLQGKTLGIIGLGNVGRAVASLVPALGMNVVACDPYHTSADCPLVDQAELLACADAITVHVPYTVDGAYPTRHLVGEKFLRAMKDGAVLVNAARGGVVDNVALERWLRQEPLRWVALDVWEGEPSIMPDLLGRVRLGSPHVAGYSIEGKWRGTHMIHDAFCEYFGLGAAMSVAWPDAGLREIQVSDVSDIGTILRDVVRQAHDVRSDDVSLRASMRADDPVVAFDLLRKNYRTRHEFPAFAVAGVRNGDLKAALQGLGFRLA